MTNDKDVVVSGRKQQGQTPRDTGKKPKPEPEQVLTEPPKTEEPPRDTHEWPSSSPNAGVRNTNRKD